MRKGARGFAPVRVHVVVFDGPGERNFWSKFAFFRLPWVDGGRETERCKRLRGWGTAMCPVL